MLTRVDDKLMAGEFLKFQDEGRANKEAKTRKFSVWNKTFGHFLGYVKWMAQWRQYTFYTVTGSILDKKCMREIADFCELKTAEQRDKRLS